MTASELATRKKELSENFTLEELIEMYLESECALSEATEKVQHLKAKELCLEKKIEAMETMPTEYDERHQHDCIRINQLSVALDVVIEKYAMLKTVMEA